LWSLNPKPEIFLLDCDNASLVGQFNPARTVRTPNWHDPWWKNPPSHEEVRGLFCLVFARLVFARQYPNSKSRLVLWPEDSPLAKSFQDLVEVGYSSDLTHRPCMAGWQSRIEEVLSQGDADFSSGAVTIASRTTTRRPNAEVWQEWKRFYEKNIEGIVNPFGIFGRRTKR
jgi:hypothetical protein